jgi:5'-nucleotidase
MRILVCNDDGYRAEGILALAEALRAVATVDIVAPTENRSGASNSLTLERPLRVRLQADGAQAVDGTPADCINLAFHSLLGALPDLVVSGINAGENLGDDVLYSGTVAAAMEACLLGTPAIAISLAGTNPSHYASAARVAVDLIERFAGGGLPKSTLLNVNVPDLPYEALQGFRLTRLGRRQKLAASVPQLDPKGRPVYWIGPAGPPGDDAGPGTDFRAIADACVSITPLQMDLTAYGSMEDLADWLGK